MATLATVALPIAKDVGSKVSSFGSTPGGALLFGLLMTINPINIVNWLIILVFTLLIYWWNPTFLRNARDETTRETYVTFGRAFLIALVPYFILALIFYTILAYSYSNIVSYGLGVI